MYAQKEQAGTGSFIGDVFLYLFLYFVIISVAIAELDIGVKNLSKDYLCSSPDLVQFGLATWLTYGGLVNIIYVTITFPIVIMSRHCSDKICFVNACYGALVPLAFIYSLFLFCWLITGFIIFDHVDSDCKNKSKPVWSMTIACFFFRILNLISVTAESIPKISKISCPSFQKNKKELHNDSTSDTDLEADQKSSQKSNSDNSNASSSSSTTQD